MISVGWPWRRTGEHRVPGGGRSFLLWRRSSQRHSWSIDETASRTYLSQRSSRCIPCFCKKNLRSTGSSPCARDDASLLAAAHERWRPTAAHLVSRFLAAEHFAVRSEKRAGAAVPAAIAAFISESRNDAGDQELSSVDGPHPRVVIRRQARGFAEKRLAAGVADDIVRDITLDCLVRIREGRWTLPHADLGNCLRESVRRRAAGCVRLDYVGDVPFNVACRPVQ